MSSTRYNTLASRSTLPLRHETLTWVAEDDRGVTLVIIAAIMPDELLIIHVMPAFGRRRR